MSRHPRRMTAQETVAILERGDYTSPSGRDVTIADRLEAAVRGTVLHRPGEHLATAGAWPAAGPDGPSPATGPTRIEVTGETTLAAAHRLTAHGPTHHGPTHHGPTDHGPTGPAAVPLALNFASAKNPGGGFLNGAHAQEEGLARSSGLYASLRAVPEFYAFHREQRDLLYSDHMIYSPAVPVFRDDAGRLLDEPYDVAFLTSPAPNRGAIRDPDTAERVPDVLRSRARRILATSLAHGHRRVVLGAWGCGVFGNDPHEVAAAFDEALRTDFADLFDHVVFAVWDTARGAPRHAAFEEVITTAPGTAPSA